MMYQVEYLYTSFDDRTDWLEFLRRAGTHPESVPANRDCMSLDEALYRIYEALASTPLGPKLADAAMTLIETGQPEEVKIAESIPYEKAPQGFERLLRLLVHQRKRMQKLNMVYIVLFDALKIRPEDELARGLLLRELSEVPTDDGLLHLAASYLPGWLVTHVPPFSSDLRVLGWLVRVPEAYKGQLIVALVAADSRYVALLLAQLAELPTLNDEYLPRLRIHPVFAAALDNK
jgi:hypothetical protein